VFAEIPVREEEGEDTPCLLKAEVETAINRLKNSKSPGVDNVTAEEIQAVGERAIDALFCLCEMIWKSEKKFPRMWKMSAILPLHKKKDVLCCDNYRGISLVPHCEKMMTNAVLQRIRNKTEKLLSEAQAGFRANRSAI